MTVKPTAMHPSTILSALIAPAVLVAASGSLVISTSQRINNVVNLLRGWSEEYAALNAEGRGSGLGEERRAFLYAEIGICTRRARFLQTALMALYVGAGLFVTTGIAVAASALFAHWDLAWGWYLWVPVALGLGGSGSLLFGCLLLIREAELALRNTYNEMTYLTTWRDHATAELLSARRRASGE